MARKRVTARRRNGRRIRARVDVSDYDRERGGRREHVRDHTREQEVRVDEGGSPSLMPLNRPRPEAAAMDPRIPGRDRLTPRIEALREALRSRVGAYGSKEGVPLTDEDIRRVDETSNLTFEEHAAFQDTQAWAHINGIISADEAQVIYNALGEVGSSANGGWAQGTDTATKVVVQQMVMELLGIKLKRSGR